MKFPVPEELAALAVVAERELLLSFFISRGEEDPAAHHGGRGMAAARYIYRPDDILSFTPFKRRVCTLGDSVSIRPPPVGPVGSRGGCLVICLQDRKGQQGSCQQDEQDRS